MRSLLWRLLWLGPALVLITLATFGAVSLALPPPESARELPLFFNPDPGDAPRRTAALLEAVTNPTASSAAAAGELARLGGAALPFVLPALDSLSPDGRARAVAALRSVGARMGFEIDERWEPSREVLFWTRFWEEHSIDYRPSVARRAVLRLGQKSTLLRDTEVRQLDTYALAELVAQMPPVREPQDVDRVRRLSLLASDVTSGAAPALSDGADLEEAKRVAAAWSDWWGEHRAEFLTYDGTERLIAMLRDTRYGAWATEAFRHDLGIMRNGEPAWQVLGRGARVTLPLLAASLVGAWAGAVLVAALLSRPGRWTRLVRGIGLSRAALPVIVAALLVRLAIGAKASQLWVGVALMALSSAPLLSLYRGEATDAPSADFMRTLRAFGVSRLRASVTVLRLSSASVVMQLGAHVSSLLTLTFVVEYALGLSGLGTQTILALREPDLNWLMAMTICTAAFIGILQALAELSFGFLDPRARDAVQRFGGGPL